MKDSEALGEAELQTEGLAVTGGDLNCGDNSWSKLERESMHQVGDHQVKYDNYKSGLELGKKSLIEGDNSNFTYCRRSPGKQHLEHDSPLQTDLMNTSGLEDIGLNIPQYQGYESSNLKPKSDDRIFNNEDFLPEWSSDHISSDGDQNFLGLRLRDNQADPTKQCAQPGNHRPPSHPEVNGRPLPGNGMLLQPIDEYDKDAIITQVPNCEDGASRFTEEAAGTEGIQNLRPSIFSPLRTIDLPPGPSSKDEVCLITGVAPSRFRVDYSDHDCANVWSDFNQEPDLDALVKIFGKDGNLGNSPCSVDGSVVAFEAEAQVPPVKAPPGHVTELLGQENRSPELRPETDGLALSVQGTQPQMIEVSSSKEEASPTTGEGEGADGTQRITDFSAGSSRPSKGTKYREKKTKNSRMRRPKACENSDKPGRGQPWTTEETLIYTNTMKQSVADGKKVDRAQVLKNLKEKGYTRTEEMLRHCRDELWRYSRWIDEYAKSNRLDAENSSSLDEILRGMSEIERKEKRLPPSSFTLAMYEAVSFVKKNKGTKPVRDGRVQKRSSSTMMKEDEGLLKKSKRMQDAGLSEPSPPSCPNTLTTLTRGESSCILPSRGTVDARSEFNDQVAGIQAGNHDLKEIRSREINVQKQMVMLESAAQTGELDNIVHQRAQTEDERENTLEVRMALSKIELMKKRDDSYRRKKKFEEELEGLEEMTGGSRVKVLRECKLRDQIWKIRMSMDEIEKELKSLDQRNTVRRT